MINLKTATGFLPYELVTLNDAIAKVNDLFASTAFQAKVMAASFTCTTDTPAQIYQKLTQTSAAVSFSIFWPSWWKRHFSSEIAYEDSQGVHFDRNKFDAESFAEICNTVAHEFCHALGYTHAYGARSPDPSVPVQIGDIIESLLT